VLRRALRSPSRKVKFLSSLLFYLRSDFPANYRTLSPRPISAAGKRRACRRTGKTHIIIAMKGRIMGHDSGMTHAVMKRIRKLIDAGEWESALQLLGHSSTYAPNTYVLRDLAGRYQREGNLRNAVRLFQIAHASEPDNTTYHAEYVRALLESAENESEWLSKEPSVPTDVLREVGGHYGRIGAHDRSLPLFRIAYDREPSNVLYVAEYVRALASAGHWDEVSRLASLRNTDKAILSTAAHFQHEGDHATAVNLFRILHERQPHDTILFVEYIRALADADEWSELSLIVGDADSRTNGQQTSTVERILALRTVAGQFSRHNDYDKAINLFRLVYEIDPNNFLAVGEYCRALIDDGNWAEVDRLAETIDLEVFTPNRPDRFHDLDKLERRICLEVSIDSAQTVESLAQLSRAVRHIVAHDIPGDFVECGVYRGASIVCIIRTLQHLGVNDRGIWLYDTFAGMPKPEPIDCFYKQSEEEDWSIKTWERRRRDDGSGGSDWAYSPLEDVQNFVSRTGYPEQKLEYVHGRVEDTLPNRRPERICLLRLDTDFYRSTKHELIHLYPRLAVGGILILDDYGAYAGAHRAADEYFLEQNVPVLLIRIDEHVRLAVKSRKRFLAAIKTLLSKRSRCRPNNDEPDS